MVVGWNYVSSVLIVMMVVIVVRFVSSVLNMRLC